MTWYVSGVPMDHVPWAHHHPIFRSFQPTAFRAGLTLVLVPYTVTDSLTAGLSRLKSYIMHVQPPMRKLQYKAYIGNLARRGFMFQDATSGPLSVST